MSGVRWTDEQAKAWLDAKVAAHRKKMEPDKIPTEHEEQCAFVEWFRLTYPAVRIIAIPNGGYRHRKTANDLKAEGVSPGVPDLFVPKWLLFIEMKRKKGGRVSDEQKDWIGYLQHNGYTCIIAHGAEDAIEQVINVARVKA